MIKAVIIIYAARVLGAAGYGVFSYAVTLAGFFTLFVDPGINSVLIREGAKASPEERQSLFSTTLIMKAAIIAASVIIVIMFAPFFSTLPGAKILLPFVALIIIFDSMREFLSSLFHAEEKMQWDAAAFLTTNLGIVIFGFIFLSDRGDPVVIHERLRRWVRPSAHSWRYGFCEKDLKDILRRLRKAHGRHFENRLAICHNRRSRHPPHQHRHPHHQLDANRSRCRHLLGRDPHRAGLISRSRDHPISTLPIFARLAKRDPVKFRLALERTVSLIFLVSIPLSLGGAILGSGLWALFSAWLCRRRHCVFDPHAQHLVRLCRRYHFNAIFAYDHQKSLIICSAIAGLGNVLFDLLLIPHWGMAGSAIATLFAQILSNSYLWYAMKKLNRFQVSHRIKKIAFAGIVMAAVTTFFFVAHYNLIVNIIISGVIYLGILLLLKEPVFSEMKAVAFPKNTDT